MNFRKVLAFGIGPIGGAALGLVTLPLITWFFSQADVGKMAMLQVAIGFSTLFFSLGLDQAYIREFHEVHDRPALLKRVISPGFIALIISLLVCLLFGDLSAWLFGESKFHLSVLVAFAILASFISRFLSLILRMEERGLAFSMSQILPKLFLLVIISSYIFVGAGRNLSNLVSANTAALLAVCLIFGINTRKEWLTSLKSSIDYQSLKGNLKFALPMIGSGIAFWGLSSVDKVLLSILSNYNELGIYSVALSFAAAATVLKSIFTTIWAPTVYKWAAAKENLEKIEYVVRYVLLLVVIVFSMVGLFSGFITYLLPREYAEVEWVVVACMGFPLFYLLSETTVVGIGITRKTLFAVIAPISALVVNVLGNYFLIPKFGASGAAASTCVAFFVLFVVRTEVSAYLWQASNRLYLYPYTSVCLLGSVVTTLYGESLGNSVLLFWGGVLFSSFIFFKDEIHEAYNWMYLKTIKRKVIV